jgi:hypothetical protein
MMTTPTPPSFDKPRSPSPSRAGQLAEYLDRRESNLVHPRLVEDELLRSDWHPIEAANAAAQYRRRFNEHNLGYSALLLTTGLAALAAGTSGHILTASLDRPLDRDALATWLSVLFCSIPFALWAHRWAARVDRDDPVAAWSRSRRTLALVLLWACAVVGVGRLVTYAAQLIGSLLGATWAQGASVAAGAINVVITISIAGPLGAWAFRFLHRFDDEDASVPIAQRHRGGR